MSLPLKTILSTQQTILSSIESTTNNGAKSSSSHISPMMTSLNNQALEKARAAIAKKFQDPIDLDELHLYTATLQKNMAVAESQLSSAVQVRYEAVVYSSEYLGNFDLCLLDKALRSQPISLYKSNTIS